MGSLVSMIPYTQINVTRRPELGFDGKSTRSETRPLTGGEEGHQRHAGSPGS